MTVSLTRTLPCNSVTVVPAFSSGQDTSIISSFDEPIGCRGLYASCPCIRATLTALQHAGQVLFESWWSRTKAFAVFLGPLGWRIGTLVSNALGTTLVPPRRLRLFPGSSTVLGKVCEDSTVLLSDRGRKAVRRIHMWPGTIPTAVRRWACWAPRMANQGFGRAEAARTPQSPPYRGLRQVTPSCRHRCEVAGLARPLVRWLHVSSRSRRSVVGVGEKSTDETLTVINLLVVPSLRRRSLDDFVMKHPFRLSFRDQDMLAPS